MANLWEENPAIRFFGEILLMVIGAAILVWIAGLVFKWSSSVDYSDGFFLACVVLAAISSVSAIMRRPGPPKQIDQDNQNEKTKQISGRDNENQEYNSRLVRFLATRSLNFKMLMSALICLLISILVAQ